MAHLQEHLQAALILGPILALLFVGSWLTLQSGATGDGGVDALQRAAENVTHAAIYLAVCLAGLAVAHRMVGYNFSLMW